MKKFLIIVSIILTVFIASVFIYTQYSSLPPVPESLGLNFPEQNSKPTVLLTDEKEGIQVTVEEVERANNETVVMLVMDNHVYDLGRFDLKILSSLNGVRPNDYQILGDQVGGHHLEASLFFPGELWGKLIIGMKDDLQFEFDL